MARMSLDPATTRLGRIVLLPGLFCPAGLLAPLESGLRDRLARPTVVLATGTGLLGVRGTAESVASQLDRLTGERIDIVGYSFGGVVASYLLRVLDRGRRIRRVVTLGAPHRGSPSALAAARLGIARALLELCPGSAFLRQLARMPVPGSSALCSLYGDRDWVVPVPFACLSRGARRHNVRLEGVSHFAFLGSEAVLERVVGVLTAPTLGGAGRSFAEAGGGLA